MGFLEELLEKGLISEQQYQITRQESKRTGKSEREIILELGFLTPEEINTFLATRYGTTYIENISDIIPDLETLNKISPSFARRTKIIPIYQDEKVVTVLASDPNDILSFDEIKTIFQKEVKVIVTKEENIIHAIQSWFYEKEDYVNRLIEETQKMVQEEKVVIGEDSPVVKLVNWIIVDAVKKRATDIHIEPQEKVTLLRYRIDGVLHIILSLPKSVHSPVLTRIKIMANLDISETRVPQDGKIRFKLGMRKIDLRISTFPTNFGESIAIRILDRSQTPLNIKMLGMPEDIREEFERMIRQPYGLILVTGPTGSGKTTTLYSALLSLNTTEKNIMTIEDPIEYELPIINQSQVQEKIGFTFTEGLKHTLRHDPDIILVGEIRDKETAQMSIRAALTGHLVLSTLHTQNAPSAITRLIEMEIEPYLVASSLIGALSQRLVRKICPHCKYEDKPTEFEIAYFKEAGVELDGFTKVWRGKGCEKCMGTGYIGRTGIFEIFKVVEEIQELTMKKSPTSKIIEAAKKYGYRTLKEDGFEKVKKGITTPEEVMRVA